MLNPNEIQAMRKLDGDTYRNNEKYGWEITRGDSDRHKLLLDREELQAEIDSLRRDAEILDYIELNVRTNSDNIAKWNLETFKAESFREFVAAIAQERKGEK